MRTRISAALIALLLLITAGCSTNEVVSEAGSPDTKSSSAPYRVIATTVDLVGIPKSYKSLPKRYDGVTQVGNPMSPNMEVVKSLDPTDVLSVTTLEYDLAPVFKNAGVGANFMDLTSVDKMNSAIQALGNKYDRKAQADAIIAKFNDKLAAIKKQTEGKKQPSVLILLGVPGSYLVATENSYIGDLVKLAGGKNIVQGEKVEYLASNTEYLQKANPDVILRAAHGLPDEVVIMFDKEFKKNDIWKHFSAVQTNRVYDLPEELFGTTGNLAAVQALDALMPMLYP
jgi:iron complex transport system substrate-binding protein